MKFWLGVTDNRWFRFLAARDFGEVNFWQPSPTPPFVNAPMGMPFLFKLKQPNHDIAGGGFFVTFSKLPVGLAWEVFGEKNGAGSLGEFQEMLRKGVNDEIGCSVLANPFFLPRDQWLHSPPGWSGNIVRGKMYETNDSDGRFIWSRLGTKILRVAASEGSSSDRIYDASERYGEPVVVRPRLGQGSFRVLVTDAYKRRCAMTGENTLIALEAAHILPFAKSGTHEISNGLLLRADFHRLFDVGLVGVTPDFTIRVSPRIREAWFNGKVYYRLNGQPLAVLPDDPTCRPDRDRLEWHLQNCFQS